MQTPTPAQIQHLFREAIALLQRLIATPSFSREEDKTADILVSFFQQNNIPAGRFGNNVWAQNQHFNPEKPTILLNSHHDTVRPNMGYTRDPFSATIENERVQKSVAHLNLIMEDQLFIKGVPHLTEHSIENGKLYGLGSNDAGGCLVSLLAAFQWFYEEENLPFNLVFAASAEEEISGKNGLEALLPLLPPIDCGIVGEPTQLQLAVAEKGLMVLDCQAIGKAGHAAREEGENAIYAALADIEWFRTFQFPRPSPWLERVKMSVTVIETPNKAHNVVPDECHFVVDVRLTDAYTSSEILATIQQNVRCAVTPRSLRLRATAIPLEHPLVQAGIALGKIPYGSPTLSDKALMPFPALKVGPGDSARSHSADEFIYVAEIREAIELYIRLLFSIRFRGV